MGKAQEGVWFTVKPRGGHKKAGDVSHSKRERNTVGAFLSSSETGGFDRFGRSGDRDVFEDVAESSATLTESSSRTSRSASPSPANASGDVEPLVKAKRKKQKTRKPKTPGQMPVSLDALNAAIVNAKSKYGDDQSSQLGSVTDFFITHYSSSELPFRKILQEQPLHKVNIVRW